MSKAIKYGTNCAIMFGAGNALINFINQLIKMDKDPTKEFSWREIFVAGSKGALVGGATGFTIGAIVDYNNSLEKPKNTDAILLTIASALKLDKRDIVYDVLSEKAKGITESLRLHFREKLSGEPSRLGSTEKGTALHDKCDIDICLPLKRDSFLSLEQMYYAIFDFMKGHIGNYSIVEVRQQKKSIGLILNILSNEYKIDIVPFRLSSNKKGKTSGYLFKKDKSFWNGDNSSYTKTDISVLKAVKITAVQKNIIILIKNWKNKNNLPLSSHLLENLVFSAYSANSNRIPRKFTHKVIMVVEFIRDNLHTISIKSAENTNNILTAIPEESKMQIVLACKKLIEEFKYQPNSILEFLSE